MKIERTYAITAQDYRRLVYFSVFARKGWTIFAYFAALVLSLYILVTALLFSDTIESHLFWAAVVFLALFGTMLIATEITVRRFLKSDTILLDKPREITITDEEIRSDGGEEAASVSYKYHMIYEGFELRNYILLFLNISQAVILPKREYTDEEIKQLSDLFTQKLQRKYKKRKLL